MNPNQLQAWIDSRGGIRAAARELDITTPTLYRYLRGEVRIKHYIALACTAVSMGIEPPWRS